MNRRRPKGSRFGRDQHLAECFGQQDIRRRDCPCPPECQNLCREIHFEKRNAPWVHKRYGHDRPYTPLPNALLQAWGPKVRPGARLCYLGLVSYAMQSRWVVARTEEVARALGLKPKRFNDYCSELEEVGLIRRVPLREVSVQSRANHHAIVLLDLPEWIPGHLTVEDVARIETTDGAPEEIDDGADLEAYFEDIEEEPPVVAPRGKDRCERGLR